MDSTFTECAQEGPCSTQGTWFCPQASGGWAFKVGTGFHSKSGKRRQSLKHGFRTKREAETALAEAQKTVLGGTVVANSNMRLDDFLDEWLIGQEARLRPLSHHSYVMAGKRLKRHLGKYKLQALAPFQIEKFYAELLDHGQRNGKGLSPKAILDEWYGIEPAAGPTISEPSLT